MCILRISDNDRQRSLLMYAKIIKFFSLFCRYSSFLLSRSQKEQKGCFPEGPPLLYCHDWTLWKRRSGCVMLFFLGRCSNSGTRWLRASVNGKNRIRRDSNQRPTRCCSNALTTDPSPPSSTKRSRSVILIQDGGE